jgi:hypothetical protein
MPVVGVAELPSLNPRRSFAESHAAKTRVFEALQPLHPPLAGRAKSSDLASLLQWENSLIRSLFSLIGFQNSLFRSLGNSLENRSTYAAFVPVRALESARKMRNSLYFPC